MAQCCRHGTGPRTKGAQVDVLLTLGVLMLLFSMIRAFAKFSWRESEREYHEYESRRGEDEDPERYGDLGADWSHWGGWGRPG
jgi:hypothetical protein